VLGYGSIGRVVANCLAAGGVPGATLSGVTVSDGRELGQIPSLGLSELAERSDLVVEAGGQSALREHGAELLETGVDLLVVSMGAMTDDHVFDQLVEARPGRLYLCTGAIGGVDMVRAAAAMGRIEHANITTIKKPSGLVQPTMSDAEAEATRNLEEITTLFDGDIRELVQKFPASTNVAAALALAVGSWDSVTGTVVADPATDVSTHIIDIEAEAGTYRFENRHAPSADNPRSSAMVPWAVVRSLRDLCGTGWQFV